MANQQMRDQNSMGDTLVGCDNSVVMIGAVKIRSWWFGDSSDQRSKFGPIIGSDIIRNS